MQTQVSQVIPRQSLARNEGQYNKNPEVSIPFQVHLPDFFELNVTVSFRLELACTFSDSTWVDAKSFCPDCA